MVFYVNGDASSNSAANAVTGLTIDGDKDVHLYDDLFIPDKIIHEGDTNTSIRFPAADTVSVETGGTERLRIDSSGRILVATTSYKTNLNSSADAGGQLAQFVGAADNTSKCVGIFAYSGTSNPTARGAKLQLNRARSTDGSTNTALANDDLIGAIEWKGNDGTNFSSAAKIDCFVEDTSVTADHMGGRLVFSTSADGSAVPTERLRIDSTGDVTITDGNLVVANTHGINFSAYATAASGSGSPDPSSNLLDDYEEGTWTAALVTGTATHDKTTYRKIGSVVHLWGRLYSPSNTTSSNSVIVTGLPFAVADGTAVGSCMAKDVSNKETLTVFVNTAEHLYFYGIQNSNAWNSMLHSNLGANVEIYYHATYWTTA